MTEAEETTGNEREIKQLEWNRGTEEQVGGRGKKKKD